MIKIQRDSDQRLLSQQFWWSRNRLGILFSRHALETRPEGSPFARRKRVFDDRKSSAMSIQEYIKHLRDHIAPALEVSPELGPSVHSTSFPGNLCTKF